MANTLNLMSYRGKGKKKGKKKEKKLSTAKQSEGRGSPLRQTTVCRLNRSRVRAERKAGMLF